MRVGVSVQDEAAQVRATLEAAGWRTTRTVEGEGFVALAFGRAPSERAVRVITRRGVVVSLDSHEPDGVRGRHGLVSIAEGPPADLDGDGRVELVVQRVLPPERGATSAPGERRCLSALRIGADGDASVIPADAGALREGACISRFEDVDADGAQDAIVRVTWAELSTAERLASVDVVLLFTSGAWRAGAMPVAFVSAERRARAAGLERARAAHDVDSAVSLAVEVAAFAHLTGAVLAAQVRRFDDALSGLVLTDEQRDRVAWIRAFIAAGWRDPLP